MKPLSALTADSSGDSRYPQLKQQPQELHHQSHHQLLHLREPPEQEQQHKSAPTTSRSMRKPRKRSLAFLSSLLCYPSSLLVDAMVPPHPDSNLVAQEPVLDYRLRQHSHNDNSQTLYHPTFVHPELCRHLSNDECQDVDENLQDHARRHRSLLVQPNPNSNGDFDDHLENNGLFTNQIRYPTTNTVNTVNHQDDDEPPEPKRNPSSNYYDDSLSQSQSSQQPPSTSSQPPLEALVLLMRFSDHRDRDLPDKSVYEELWNDRIRTWFDRNSYGHYQYHAHVTDWMDTNQDEATYAAGMSGLQHSMQEAFWPLLDRLTEDPTWDWSRFDANGDGKLDAVVVLHSGYPAEVGGLDCTNDRAPLNRIWSHAFASSETWTTLGVVGSEEFHGNIEYLVEGNQTTATATATATTEYHYEGDYEAEPEFYNDNSNTTETKQTELPDDEDKPEFYALHGYVIASALEGVCGSSVAKMGVMVHEYMHTLGLDDLYDYGSNSNGKGIGIWDILAYPYGAGNDENYPGHLSAYSKVSLGWLSPTEVSWKELSSNSNMDGNTALEQVLSLRPSEISDDAIKIVLTKGKTPITGDEDSVTNQPPPPPEQDESGEGPEQAAAGTTTKLLPQYQSHNGNYEEYLLLEHRQALEFDRDLGNRTGLVIYHVDESVPRMNNAGFPGQEGWPRNGNHYRVAVLAADTQFHLERGINKGDSQDTWKPGLVLGPGSRHSRAGTSNSIVYPNTDTYQYGMVRETGLSIETVSESLTELTVRISWDHNLDETENGESTATVAKAVGTQQGKNNAKSTEPELDNCVNLYPSVDLQVEDPDTGKLYIISVSCNDVASDPNQYCFLTDFSMGWQVWEICRRECPTSDCHV